MCGFGTSTLSLFLDHFQLEEGDLFLSYLFLAYSLVVIRSWRRGKEIQALFWKLSYFAGILYTPGESNSKMMLFFFLSLLLDGRDDDDACTVFFLVCMYVCTPSLTKVLQ